MPPRALLLTTAALVCLSRSALAEQDVPCERVGVPPLVDGRDEDPAWSHAPAVVTRDAVAGINHELRCVHDGDSAYFLVRFPDADENREHKTLVWDESQDRYRLGPAREDTFVFKWNMEPLQGDLSLSANRTYKADIWYWKSVRTDHAGFADDKVQTYVDQPMRRSKKLISKDGQRFYLTRRGDAGDAAYVGRDVSGFEGATTSNYELRPPTGSRADVRAKGR